MAIGQVAAGGKQSEIIAGRTLLGLAMNGTVESTVTRDGMTTTERRFYLTSAAISSERFALAVRAHWRIENSLH